MQSKFLSKSRYPKYDCEGIRATEGVFGIHSYPAMLHHFVVGQLIEEFSREGDLVLDPFCGSGVTVAQAIRKGRRSIGIDINPLAILIGQARCMKAPENIEDFLYRLEMTWGEARPDIPTTVKNIDYWFQQDVQESLGKIRAVLLGLPDDGLAILLKTAFAQTIRECSNVRKGEFKRYRIPVSKMETFRPDVLKTFVRISMDYVARLKASTAPSAPAQFYLHDMRNPLEMIHDVDLVVTSPPYGDSRTTVAYGEFSSFAIEWMDGMLPRCEKLDKLSLGGKPREPSALCSSILDRTISKIARADERRADGVAYFFSDLADCIKNIARAVRAGGKVCFVVGNRIVKNVTVPMDEITVDLFKKVGFSHVQTRIRKIHNKRMPSMNSPSNVAGDTNKTMTEEYVVILRKD